MIARLTGTLAQNVTGSLVIDCHGVGYGVSVSVLSANQLAAVGTEVTLHIFTHVGEDVLRLYGFVSAVEKQVFEILLNTSGVGPKLALTILGTLSPNELTRAVYAQDKSAFTRTAGVGAKKAERLLVELKGRLDDIDFLPDGQPSAAPVGASSLRDDLESALSNLGFARPVAERVAQAALVARPDTQDLAELVREALQRTTTRAGS